MRMQSLDMYFEHTKKLAMAEMQSFNSATGKETNCDVCKGRGYVAEIIKDNNRGFYMSVKECPCMANKRNMVKAKNSGTDALLSKSFDNYIANTIWQQNIKNLAIKNSKTKDWFYIGGQSGAGKTHICSAITNYQSRNNIRVKYLVWTDEINKLKDYEDDSFMQTVKKVECLYIDDLFKKPRGINGLPNLTTADIDKTWELINFRYLNKLKTIISSELSLEQIIKIDESLGSRIKQNAREYVISLGKDVERNMRLH